MATKRAAAAQHYVAVQAAELAAEPTATAAVLVALGQRGAGLGAIHVGLMAVMEDLVGVPAPEALRSSRDVRELTRGLEALEGAGLASRERDRLVLTAPGAAALRAGLEAAWEERAAAAEARLGCAEAPAPAVRWDDLRSWLRHLVVVIANRGLRLTRAGSIHNGDLRFIQGMRELPPQRFFDLALRVGGAMRVLLELETTLLVGNDVDLLDLDAAGFGAAVLAEVARGQVDVGHAHVSAMAGLLGRWAPLVEGGELEWTGAMTPEPVSDFLPEAALAGLGPAARSALREAHLRVRAGLIGLMGRLPRGVMLPLEEVCALAHAHLSLDLLRRPCRVPVPGGAEPVVLASATRALPALEARVREHLPAWLRQLWTPLGAAFVEGEQVWVRLPAPVLLESLDGAYLPRFGGVASPRRSEEAPLRQGRLRVQPTGEVLAPPDVSIHGVVHLAQGAELVRLGDVVTLNITQRSLLRLLQSGMAPEVWGEAVASMAGAPLPSTVVSMIEVASRRRGEVRLSPAGGVLVVRDAIRLDELLSHPRMAGLGLLRPAPTVLVLPPGCDLEVLLGELEELGFAGELVDQR